MAEVVTDDVVPTTGTPVSDDGSGTGEQDLDVGAVAEQVERLLDQLAEAGPLAAERAESLVRALMGLYGAGLGRILDQVGAQAPQAVRALADDPLVAGLLSLHDLHPIDTRDRVEQALDDVRPYLGSHGGDVSVLAVEDGVVRLRLEGTCDGCPSSQATLEGAVESAILTAAPEVVHIDVEGAVPASTDGLIPLESLRRPPLECPTEISR